MANREALSEMEARLAQRLMAAESGGAAAASWLAVQSAGHHFLLPLGLAGEICALSGLQAVPHARPWFLGVQNVRGSLMGVVDLAGFLALGSVAAALGTQSLQSAQERRVVTLSSQLEVNCGLLVERLLGLRSSADFPTSAPAPEGAPAYLGQGLLDAQGTLWRELDLRALAQSPAFLSISL